MKQSLSDVLAVSLACPTTMAVGDVAIIDTAKTVKKLDAAGSLKIVGTVVAHLDGATECTIETRFRDRPKEGRPSGAAISAPGPFVFDAAQKVIPYSSATHDPASIAGLVITTANAADVVVETLEL